MTFQQELLSWKTPEAPHVINPVPIVGESAPSSAKLPFPNPDGKPTIIAFLRHCGCPFAEKNYRNLRYHANRHPEAHFVAISHSTAQVTEEWIIAVGGEWDTQVIVDEDRSLYALWGLGISNTWHVLNPWSLYSVYELGKKEGIWNRPTESGSRWQISGSWAIDGKGVVRWGGAAKAADEIHDFKEALLAVGIDPKKGATRR